MPDYSAANLRNLVTLSPAEQAASDAYENSPAARAEFDQALAAETDPAKRRMLMEYADQTYGGRPASAPPAPTSALASYLARQGVSEASPRAGGASLSDFLDNQTASAPAPQPKSGLVRRAADYALSGLQGAISVPQAAVGLADVVTGGRVGKALENDGGDFGFRPDEANAYLETLKSPEQQEANKKVQDASVGQPGDDQGLAAKMARVGVAAVQNPSVIAHSVVQSLPSMMAGGVLGRGAMMLAPRMGAAVAGGIGEGLTTIGQQAEQIRTDDSNKSRLLSPTQAALAAGSGAVTGAIGVGAGSLAQKLGLENAETLLVGAHADPAKRMSLVRQVIGGAVTEGLLEELPQSVQEQVAQNIATDQPWDKDVDQQAVLGMLSGSAMGVGAQAFHGQAQHAAEIREQTVPDVGPLSRGANDGIEAAAQIAETSTPLPAAPAPAPIAPDQTEALLAHANERAAALTEKEKGAKDEKADDGKVTPGTPPQFLTPEEKAEQDFLNENGGDANALAAAYPDFTKQPAETAAEPAPAPAPESPPPLASFPTRVAAEAYIRNQRMGGGGRVSGYVVEQPDGTFSTRAGTDPTPVDDIKEAPLPDDILNPKGEPFKTRAAVLRAQSQHADPKSVEIASVNGGYVLRPVGQKAAAPAPVMSFTTAKGSTYSVDGTTTTRDKAARSDVGHEGDFGPKPASQRTFYVDDAGAQALSEFQAQGGAGKPRIVVSDDGRAGVQYRDGPQAGKIESRTVTPFHDQPAVGLTPVELWKDGKVVHFGNKITEVRGEPSVETVDEAAHVAAPSPNNDLPEPTQAQKEAGNYQKGHVNLNGLDLSIENPAGSVRRGVDRDGKPWENELQHHYGYIKGTVGNDKDHFDLFVKPGTPTDYAGPVFIVDQVHPDSGEFDEHKALVGFGSEDEARKAYASNYADDRQGLKSISEMPFDEFKSWVKEGPKNEPLVPIASKQDAAAPTTEPGGAVIESGPAPAEEPAAAAPARDVVEHVTAKGKTLVGVVRKDITLDEAKAIDGGSFRKDGGVFIRERSFDALDRFDAERAQKNSTPEVDSATSATTTGTGETPAPDQREAPPPGAAAPTQQPGDILNKDGKPFKSFAAASIARRQAGDRHEIVRVPQGLVLRKAANEPEAARAPAPVAAPVPAAEKPTPSKNRIFTEDAANEARAVLKRKLGNLNSGIDPEILQAGITLAGYHIEKGARTFAAFAQEMVADLGDAIRPYLKSFYMAVKYDPRATAFEGMSTAAEVEAHDLSTPAQAEKPSASLADRLKADIAAGRMPKDNLELKRVVREVDGSDPTPERMKAAQEALEAAIVSTARAVVAKKEGPRSTFDALVRLYDSQPNLNVRSSTSVENQAYSTPAPLAYVASELAGITRRTTVLEPTAGNGMLLIAADPKKTTANELNPERAAALREQGFTVTEEDATAIDSWEPNSQDVVVANPPFGPLQGGSSRVQGYNIRQIDQLIAARALQTMKDDGRAVLIIGANKVAGGRSNDDLVFFNWLYGHYNVTSHFEVDGDLYRRQGAGWPVRVITVQGRLKSSTVAPEAGTIARASTWSEVYERFQQGLAAGRSATGDGASAVGGGSGRANEPRPVSVPADRKARRDDSGRPEGGAARDGNVAGAGAGAVGDRGAVPDQRVGERTRAVGPDDSTAGAADGQGAPGGPGAAEPAGNPRTPGLTRDPQNLDQPDNQFQVAYAARSSRKDEGVLIPVNMAGPTQDALNRLEDAVGDIDEFARKELGYPSKKALHDAFMGLQVDSVASAINQIKGGKGVIIADQTGIGKGRQAAAIIRWAARNGKVPVFVTVKPSLFTDMYGDLHDIGTDDIAPLILNVDEWIKGQGDDKLFANRPGLHKRTLESIAAYGKLPPDRNALFMTYSQVNVANTQRKAVEALAPNAVFILDESHNAGGDSSTGKFIRDTLGLASGVTYLSATYAKRPDNMPVYFKTDMGEAVADDDTLMAAMEAGGLPLQTVVANNLVKAGQMFRRERSYDGVSIETRADTEHKAEHVALSDSTTQALRAIVKADKIFHEVYVKALQKELAKQGERALDNAGNQAQESVDHTQFSSVVHNFVRQMLLGLKAQEAANDAVRSLKRGEKPLIAVENTMGSFLDAYVQGNAIKVGDVLPSFDYRTVLSRALERSRYLTRQLPTGDKVKEYVPLSKLDPMSYEAYQEAQRVIDGLKIDIPVSPIDWMRQEITNAGFSVAEITGRDLAIDYSDPKNPRLTEVDPLERKDKVRTTRNFNAGNLDALILNVAGSTGISLHASEKFKDQRQRHMIVAQPAQDINIFMQMLGRIHRTGQVRLPKYTILNADLPAEIRPTALLSAKMKSLNANTSSNTESATSVQAVDMLNKYGDQVVGQYLADNPGLADALGLDGTGETGEAPEDIARRATGRLALMPVRVQEQFYAEVEEQYRGLLDYLNKTNQNELEPRTFDLDAKETKSQVLFEGQNPESPFGEDAIYNEYSVKAQGKPMTPVEIRQAIKDNLGGQTREAHTTALLGPLMRDFTTLRARLTDEQQKVADEVVRKTTAFIEAHPIGSMFRVDINGDVYNAIVTNIRSTHKAAGNPYSLSKVQVTIAVNGALRSVTVPATQFQRIETNTIGGHGIEGLFKVGILNDRETAKIITGNLLGAYGELDGTRGSIISFTKADGTTEQGILLPKKFDLKENVRQDYRLKSAEDAFKFVRESQNENIERFGINSRDGNVRVLPAGDGITIQVPKSKAKGGRYFLDSALRAATGDFYSSGSFMRATVRDHAKAVEALDVLMKKQALYALPSMANEARSIVGDEAEPPRSAVASRGAPVVGGGMDAQALRAMVTPIVSSWKNGPKGGVTVVQTADQLPIGVLRSDPDGVAKAWFDPDSQAVYMVASQIKNAGEAQFVLFHEVYGHYGMRSLLGDDYGPAMMRLRLANQQIAARASMWFTRYGRQEVAALVEGGMDRMAAERQVRLLSTEEALADRAGDAEPLKAWQSVAAVIQRTLRSLGLSRVADWIENHTEAETLSMLARARRNVQQRPGEAGAARMSATPAAASREMPVASRGLSAGLAAGVNNAKEVALPAGYVVGDLFNREGKLNWWHKTVGTMHNLAERNPTFKRVYDATQNFINDTSAYATEAADLAPRMLPKLETWKDITKSPLSPEDTQAIAAPIFEGTLTWGRDESGKPVRMADKEAAAEQMDSEQKARELFRRGLVTEPVLKMWQGLPIDQFESIINGKYDRDVLRAGVVWTDDELKSMFKLNDSQIGLYHEFREATDRSLKNLAVSDMLRFGGKDVAAVRDEVLAAATVDRAAEILRDHLFERADSEPERAEVLNDTANKMIDKGDRATDLMKRGYAPLSRFGHYTLDVVNPDGERAYFGMFESAPERSKMARAMRVQYPNATIEQGTVSEEAYKLFAGVSPETLELFGGMLGLESDGTAARDQAFQQFLKLAKANRSAMKRLIERKGIAGFSEDAGRVLAGFVYSNARQTSVNLHGPEISEAVADVPKGPGELRDAAEQLRQYVSNPQEEAQGLRGLLFAQYLGGSVASAIVNMTQPIAVTFPYLSQYGGITKAAAQMVAATKDATKRTTGDKALDAALKHAEDEGIVAPQEVHQLMAQAQGRAALKSGDGTTAGNAAATASNALSRLSLAWGKVFGVAEQFNRRVTFIAAYRTAVAQGMENPAKFAADAVSDTQFTYNKGNKPKWARGAIGGTLFTFKQYSINYVELLHRMWTQGGPEGKKAALLALAVLFLMSGADGLPFAQDAEDVIDGAMQRLGYNFSAKRARQEFFANMLGAEDGDLADRVIAHGVSGLPGVPIDVAGRFGLGNLIPGTGLLTKKADHTSDAMEILGPAGDFAQRAGQAAGQLLTGDVATAANTIAPTAARNMAKAYDMANTGMYRDSRGRKVIDTDGYDAFAKAIGFQPNSVARVQEATAQTQQMIGQAKLRETELADQLAEAMFERDPEKVQSARDAIARWNEDNPTSPIKIGAPQLAKRLRAMRMSKTDRIAKTAPAEIRATVKRELAGSAP